MRKMVIAWVVLAGMSGAAVAKPALNEVEKIDNGLFAVGLANEIRRNCPHITPRFFKAIAFLRDLRVTARDMGYSEAEVEAHLDSDVEKDRLRARAAKLMNERGLVQDQQGYCTLGRQEIAAGTTVGQFLREVR